MGISLSGLLLSVTFSPVVLANTVKTATGNSVTHSHPAYCTPGTAGCTAQKDSVVESTTGFKATDRVYNSTVTWNCHGRTFNNRQSWIPYAEPYLNYDGPYTPAAPKIGDAIVFWGSDNKTSHTVTIVGSWNGTSTMVMSKYGPQGQYKHALSNTIRAYSGNRWGITRFGAGTIIYTGFLEKGKEILTNIPRLFVFNGDNSLLGILASNDGKNTKQPSFDVDTFIAEQSKLPWYQEVMKEMPRIQQEHDEMVQRIGKMNEINKKRLETAQNDDERIKILLEDIQDETRFGLLTIYSSPGDTVEFFEAMEAKKMLMEIVKKDKTLKEKVTKELKTIAKNGHQYFGDQKKGVSLFLLGRMLDKQEKENSKKELSLAPVEMSEWGGESYEHFYWRQF